MEDHQHTYDTNGQCTEAGCGALMPSLIVPKQEEHPNLNAGHSMPGNQNALKFDTTEKRQALCKAWCDHLQQGYTKDSFPQCDEKTFKNYRENFPSDFPSEVIEEAERKNILFWETIGINGTVGIPVVINNKEYTKFNAKAFEFNVMNRFPKKWKIRQDLTSDDQVLKAPQIYTPQEDPDK